MNSLKSKLAMAVFAPDIGDSNRISQTSGTDVFAKEVTIFSDFGIELIA